MPIALVLLAALLSEAAESMFRAVRPGLGSIDAPHRGLRADKCAGDRLDQHREPLDDERTVGNVKKGAR